MPVATPGYLLFPITAVAFGAWLVALVSALRMVRNRRPGVTRLRLAMDGFAFFDDRNFTDAARPDAVRMRRAFAVFFAAVFLSAAVALAYR